MTSFAPNPSLEDKKKKKTPITSFVVITPFRGLGHPGVLGVIIRGLLHGQNELR